MLIYDPDKRATAQEVLNDPWLSMEPNFEFKMTDREYEKMTIFKKTLKTEKKTTNQRDVVESETEKNHADDEDNDVPDNELENDSTFIEYNDNDAINIQNFNNSFSIYGQHVKLSALDKPNPQFK